ncbi:fungal-specific transcription factor domain-containing protein [Ganoderma leucocontextum]|nr:fungal-specific transcription factor domain-containing protein [Ganoderma leucocontextum]
MPSGKVNPPRASDLADGSDDDAAGAGPSGQGKTQRIAKACDRCRKSKSKCQPAPNEGDPCKSCASTGAECTYTAPSFRRGPPKGYIQALEHRLHQVESVLAAIMSSTDPRSQSIIEELGQDELAGYILETVDAGPFGNTGRKKRSIDTTKDNFFASIVTEQPKTVSHRSRRESRVTRENVIESVIATDPQIRTTRPTLAWQDRLSARLVRTPSASQSLSPRSAASPPGDSTDSHGSEPPRIRRRLDGPSSSGGSVRARLSVQPPQRDADADGDNLDDCANAFGNLSIDENREVRYHGNSAGLQLLALTERSDERNSKGIWRFPMAKIWPGPPNGAGRSIALSHAQAVQDSIHLPPVHVQDYLIQVFFTYANPAIPVLDEDSFMAQYNAQKYGYRDPEDDDHTPGAEEDVRPERPQRLSKLLLLAMFAYAASHLDPRDGRAGEGVDPAGDYTKDARTILDTIYHESRSSTVQALILLGIREFGAGSLEEGWLHIGMSPVVRDMSNTGLTGAALDLGLNRNPDKWTHNGRELFNEKEKTIRKRIWWACCLADKFSALFLGRTIGIHEGDFSTPLLDIPPDDVEKMWQPCPPDPLCARFTPIPAMYVSYFRYLSSLYVIAGEVLAKIYRVSRANVIPSRTLREQLYHRLMQWSLELPNHLNYTFSSNRPCPAPHILAMHIQYWSIVLLMHRPFIPKGSDLARAGSPSLDPDPVPWESFDICQSAAHQIASFAMLYQDTYHMKWAPPFLSNCLQAAGILCVVTLRFRPMDTQASVALQKLINALAGLEQTWITAYRVRDLVQNAKVHVDRTLNLPSRRPSEGPQNQPQTQPQSQGSTRQKRSAEVAFDDITFSPPPRCVTSVSTAVGVPVGYQPAAHNGQPHFQPSHVYHPGLQRDGAAPSTYAGYVPGYDSWWPVLEGQTDASAGAGLVGPARHPDDGSARAEMVVPGPGGAGAAGLPSQDFTFTTQHFSPEFLQAMRDPVIHFPSVFAHQGY